MNMYDRQDEVAAILAQTAMIAEDVNVIALAGSGAGCTPAEQMAIIAEVKLRVGEMTKLRTLMLALMDAYS
jgi:hypothetical protein